MNAFDAIISIAEDEGRQTNGIGPALGKPKSYFYELLLRGAPPRCDELSEMLDVLGYELCAIPRGDAPASAVKIDASD